jgi:hypothetical protein
MFFHRYAGALTMLPPYHRAVIPWLSSPSTTSRRTGSPLYRPQSPGWRKAWPTTTDPGPVSRSENRPAGSAAAGVRAKSYRRQSSPVVVSRARA